MAVERIETVVAEFDVTQVEDRRVEPEPVTLVQYPAIWGRNVSPFCLKLEAWLKLASSPRLGATSRLHFKRIAARAMRQVLIEAARRRNADKRGGGAEVMVNFDESTDTPASCSHDLLVLDSALDELARLHPRQAMMVECRFFGGFDITETAALLEVSEETIFRDWRAAKAWLGQELRRDR